MKSKAEEKEEKLENGIRKFLNSIDLSHMDALIICLIYSACHMKFIADENYLNKLGKFLESDESIIEFEDYAKIAYALFPLFEKIQEYIKDDL